MELSTFTRHLEQATASAVLFARRFVTTHLPDEVRYLVRSVACDSAGAIDRLWQDGEVPVWIDIAVDSADDRFTYLRISFSGRTTSEVEALRYRSEGHPPFQCLGPALPAGWKDIEQSGQFDLHWRKRPTVT